MERAVVVVGQVQLREPAEREATPPLLPAPILPLVVVVAWVLEQLQAALEVPPLGAISI